MNEKKYDYNPIGNRNDRVCRTLLAKELLSDTITHVIDVGGDSYFWKEDIDLICVSNQPKNRFITVEIKADGYRPSANGKKYIFCETISNSNKYLITSGREGIGNLFITKSDYMLYYFIHTDTYLIVDTNELQEFVKNNMRTYTVKSSDTYGYDGQILYTSYGLLVPVEDILHYLSSKLITSRHRFEDFLKLEETVTKQSA